MPQLLCNFPATAGTTFIHKITLFLSSLADLYDENKDGDLVTEEPDYKPEPRECIFSKGQSKRLWNELYKVVDSSDVIIQVYIYEVYCMYTGRLISRLMKI